jgi:hypothetical protein
VAARGLSRLGEDITETLEVVPKSWKAGSIKAPTFARITSPTYSCNQGNKQRKHGTRSGVERLENLEKNQSSAMLAREKKGIFKTDQGRSSLTTTPGSEKHVPRVQWRPTRDLAN